MNDADAKQYADTITYLQVTITETIADGLDGLRTKYRYNEDICRDLDTIKEIFLEKICVAHADHFGSDIYHVYSTLLMANVTCKLHQECPDAERHQAWEEVCDIIRQTPDDVLEVWSLHQQ